MLRLLDSRDNPISPALLSLTATIDGGSFLDSKGALVDTMRLDVIESEIIFSYISDTPGSMKIDFRLTDPSLTLTQNIRVIERPAIRIIRSAIPKVAGDTIDMQIELIDGPTGQILTGFSSLATLDIPIGAGKFSHETFEIIDGKSKPFQFIPGKKAGDHLLKINIPGITNTTEQVFQILP